MTLDPTDLSALNQLLDQALDLEPEQLEGWLTALPPEHVHLVARLRDMLAMRSSHQLREFMVKGPILADMAVVSAGERVGPYRLLREIGSGGMGIVWLAERADGAYQRQVALKLPRLAWGSNLAERMARERDIDALLEHPSIARLYDAGVDERGRPFLAFEYIDGQPIDTWCETNSLDIKARMNLFVQVIKAVGYAHGRLVVHRDLKPSNVMVTADGQVHLLDFGIAKLLTEVAATASNLTQEQGRVLTPQYASPEQIAGEPVTVASDIYSLGVLLYELLTDQLPITPARPTLGAMEDAILQGDAPLASSRVQDKAVARTLRGDIDAILTKAMQLEPTRRYATADALAQDIERHLNGQTVTAQPNSKVYRLRKALRRHWVGASATAAVLVAVLSGAGVAVVEARLAAKAAVRERVVKEFVADVFRVNSRVNPANASLRPTSTQSLIEGGAQLIQTRFAGQPDLQAELYGVVGGVFSDMGAYRLATDYSKRQVESLTLLRADDRERAKASIKLAQALADDNRFAEAELQARSVLELARGNPELEVESMLLITHSLHASGKITESAQILDRSDKNLDMLGNGPSSLRAKALVEHAALLATSNHRDEAYPLFERAIDMAVASEGRLSATAISARLSLATELELSTHAERSLPHLSDALMALHELGGAHEAKALLVSAEHAANRWSAVYYGTELAAEAEIKNSLTTLSLLQIPIPNWYVPQVQFWLGLVKAQYQDIEGALPLLEASLPFVEEKANSPKEHLRIAMVAGDFYKVIGRHDLAEKWFTAAIVHRREAGLENHPFSVNDYINLADNLNMQGRHDEALKVLDKAPKVGAIRGEGGVNADRYSRFLTIARIGILLDKEDTPSALKLLNAMTPIEGELQLDMSALDGLRGQALCDSGHAKQGFPLLQKSLHDYGDVSVLSPNSPFLALARASVGNCALAAGNRKEALQLSRQARAAFAVQPGVSPYYKAPLFKLERALGLHLAPV